MTGTCPRRPSVMKDSELVVELGTEEIPAWMLEGMADQFAQALVQRLKAERLESLISAVWYTPRRVIVGLGGIPVRQTDLYETITGPPRSVAFDAQGEPTKAALAFAQKNGVDLADIRIVQTPKGEYLSTVRKVQGNRTRDILQRLIPEAITGIQFPRAMHWTPDQFRFVRPLRWILALYNGRTLRFGIADVKASNFTMGHRFMGKPRIVVSSLASLKESLRQNGVLVDPAERERVIREGLALEAAACGGSLLSDEALLKTVINLNEFPSVISGSFESRFLELPREILVTVMREHQKYFSVLGPDGVLMPVFLAAVNLKATDPGKIRAGHERVLRARLADAAFFWQTDCSVHLADRLESLRSVLFQEKLGSYYDKTRRLLTLLPRLAETAHCSGLVDDLLTAGQLAKCDLVTEMVKEFTDLQGVVGGLYARAEGYPEVVWRAVYEQYLPKAANSASPSTLSGALLALADRLDSVCGCFSVGLIPSGSKDPFAVRRQGNGILKILFDHGLDASLESLIQWSLSAHGVTSGDVAGELKCFFEGRLRFLFEEAGYSYDCINAVLAAGFDYPRDTRDRVSALQAMHSEQDFLSVASNFKRIMNILAQVEGAQDPPDPSRLIEPAEIDLWETYLKIHPCVEDARRRHDYMAALSALASMRQVVDTFFDKVLVMAEDRAVRSNRLALLRLLSRTFLSIADISQIVLERSA